MLKRILIAVLFAPLLALAQSYPSPTFQNVTINGTLNNPHGVALSNLAQQTGNTVLGNGTNATGNVTALPMPGCNAAFGALTWVANGGFGCNTSILANNVSGVVAVANGGTNATSASGTALDNISGFAGTGFLTRTGAGAYSFQSLTNGIGYGNLAQAAANTVLANATGSTGNLAAVSVPGCNSASSGLTWIAGSGFGCNSTLANTTGATFTGNLLMQYPSAGTQRSILWYNNASVRWALLNDGSTETGGNAGSNFILSRNSDAGTFIDNPINVSRATGNVSFIDGITVPSASIPTTALSGLGAGVATGLTTSANTGNGFVTYNQYVLSGAGTTPYAYGAVGNGSTDDTTAIQNWVNGSSTYGQPAFCSSGTYKITKTINLTAQALKIVGPGGTACTFLPSLATAPTVSGAAAGPAYPNGGTSIRLTVSSTANIGTAVEITGVNGTTEANGAWPSVVIDSTHVDIVGPAFAHTYTSSGYVVLPVFALSPSSQPNSAAQPTLDLSGVYFGTPAANASTTDAIVITGGPFFSVGSSTNLHDFTMNGYRRGILFWQSYNPIVRNVYFYNQLGAALVANQDTSFSNGVIDHSQFFSNGNTNGEAATILGGGNWVENPAIFNSQWSGNWAGIMFAGNVHGASVIGNYLENNTNFNLYCGSTAVSQGANISGNWLSYNSGTNSTYLQYCTSATFSNNWLNNQTITLGGDSVVLAASNHLTGTSVLNYPASTPSSIVSSTVATTAISSGAATNVTSVSLAQGNWECTGSTLTHPAGSTTQNTNVTALSIASGGFPGSAPGEIAQASTVAAGSFVGQTTGPVFYTFSSATTLYLVALVSYATSTLTIDGDIHCHRIF